MAGAAGGEAAAIDGEDAGADAWLTLHKGVPPPANFLLARDVAWAAISVSGVFFLWSFAAMLQRYLELRRHVAYRGSKGKGGFQKQVVGWMLVNTGFNVMQQLLNSIMFGVDAAARSTVYCQASHKMSAFAFLGAMWGNYMVLVIRARTTSVGAGKLHQVLQRASELIALAGLPAIMLASLFLFRGRVLFDSVCTQELPTVVVYIFMAADSSLSLMLLLLFVLPVMKHLRSVSSTGGSGIQATDTSVRRLRRLAVKNMKLSAVQVVTTFVVQLVGAISQTLISDEHHPDLAYWRWVRYGLYGVDLTTNTVTLMLMSDAWVPKSWPHLQRFMARHLDNDSEKAGDENTASSARGDSGATLHSKVRPAKHFSVMVPTSVLIAGPANEDAQRSSSDDPNRAKRGSQASP